MSLRELAKELLSFRSELPLRIHGLEEVIGREQKIRYAAEKFIPLAKSNINIVERKLPSEFYNDERIVSAFEEAASRGVEIEILHGPEVDLDNNELSRLQKEGKVKLFPLKTPPHTEFWVVDGKHTLSEYRPSFFCGVTNTLFLAQEYEKRLITLKEQIHTA